MARTGRFTYSVVLGFAGQAITMVAGLWLTPFLLRTLGQTQYGWWIVGQQLLVYLTLMDFGVVALLPRETAYLTGAGAGGGELPRLLARTMRIVLTQTPVVAAITGLLWLAIPHSLGAVRPAAGLIALALVLLFPLRIFRAALEGLQDLAFTGMISIASWSIGLVISVVLVGSGFGLKALVAGWAASQLLEGGSCYVRFRCRFPDSVPQRWIARESAGIREQLHRGFSVSVSQIAQVLIYGTDAAIVGRLFGPAAVVPYSCTGKLFNVLANQPQLIMRAAEPGLSQMRVTENQERLASVTTSLGLAMLLSSGLVTAFTLAVNPSFVAWWIGDRYFGGVLLTVLFAISMVLRHLNITAIYSLFALGRERDLAVTSLADGILSTVLSLFLAALLHSPAGVILGSILSTCAVLVFGNGRLLARELRTGMWQLALPLCGWFLRMLFAGGGACFLSRVVPHAGLAGVCFTGAVTVVGYALLMIPVVLQPELRPYLEDRLRPFRERWERWHASGAVVTGSAK